MESPVAQKLSIHERLGVRPTCDYAAAILGPGSADALLSENWGLVRREAIALAEVVTEKGGGPVPRDHHALGREGRTVWLHRAGDSHHVAIARVFRHEALDYEREELRLLGLTGLRGAPILFVAIARDERGDLQATEIDEAGGGFLGLREFDLRDLRGILPRSQDPTMRRLGEGLIHPILPLPAALPQVLPAVG